MNEDKPVVIVTGASRGLGAAIARQVARMGGRVVLNGRSRSDLRSVATEIEATAAEALVVAGDVSREDICHYLVERAVAHFGRLDALINNAGVLQPVATMADAESSAWRANIEVNLLAPFYLAHHAIPHLRPRKGRVVNVSSGAAVNAEVGWSAYCAAKAGLNHLTRVLAAEEESITSLAFRPGVVDTEMQALIREEGQAGMQNERHRRFVRAHEEGALLPPEEPGRAAAALALYAPAGWSGEFLAWDEDRVQELVAAHGA